MHGSRRDCSFTDISHRGIHRVVGGRSGPGCGLLCFNNIGSGWEAVCEKRGLVAISHVLVIVQRRLALGGARSGSTSGSTYSLEADRAARSTHL